MLGNHGVWGSGASWLAIGLLAVQGFGTAGCGGSGGPEFAKVYGTVTLDGNPLDRALVTFSPEGDTSGSPSLGETDSDGQYELRFSRSIKGALVGSHTVQISTAIEIENEEGDYVRMSERVPVRYNAKTELVRKVESGRNKIDFELEGGGEIANAAR